MNHHEGVVCNGCMKANFQGLCYRCLTCRDFDLCSDCYERDFNTYEHPFDHPMKCVLTQMDIELYFGGEYITGDPPQSYRCPYCKEWGFNESTFLSHAAEMHPNACPQLISTMVSLYEQQQAARIFLEEEQLMAHAAATTARNRIVNRHVGLELSLHPLNRDGTIRESGSEETEENINDGNTTNNDNNNNGNSNINIFGQPSSTTSNDNRAIRFRIRPRRNRTGGNGSVGSSDEVSGSRGGGNTSGSGDSNTNVSERAERSTGGGLTSAVQNSITHLRNVLRRHTVRQVQQHQQLQTAGRNSAIQLTLPSIPEHNNPRSTRSNDSIFGTPERLRLAVSDSERALNVFMPRQAALESLIPSDSSSHANDTNPTQATLNEMMRFYSNNFEAITNEAANRVNGGSAGGGGAGVTGGARVSGISSVAAAAGGYNFNRSGSTHRTRLRILPDPIAIQNPPFEIHRERLNNFSRAIATLPTNVPRSSFVSLINNGQRNPNTGGNNPSTNVRSSALRPLSPSYRQRVNNNNNNTNNNPSDLLNGNLTLAGPYRLALANNTNDTNNNNNNLSNAALHARNIIFLRNVDDEFRIIDELNLSQVHLPIWPPDEMDSTHNNNSVPVNIVPAVSAASNNENDAKKNEDKDKFLLNAYLKPQQENENYSKFQENRAEFVAELVMSALRDTELDFPEKFLLPDAMSFHNWSQGKKTFELSATVGAGDGGGATFESTSHVSLRSDDLIEIESLIDDDIDDNVDDVYADDEFPEEFI